MKYCSKCAMELPDEVFWKNSTQADGLASNCHPSSRLVHQQGRRDKAQSRGPVVNERREPGPEGTKGYDSANFRLPADFVRNLSTGDGYGGCRAHENARAKKNVEGDGPRRARAQSARRIGSPGE